MPRKTVILTMNYSSIKNVAEDIAYVLRKNNEIVTIITEPNLIPKADKLIIFVPFAPSLLNLYLYAYNQFKGEKYFYTTCDGIPIMTGVNQYLLQDITFIPNSKFTAKNLQEVGLFVDVPVFHGVNFEKIEKSKSMAEKMRQKLEKDFPNSVKFGIVTGTTKRKNIDLLVETFRVLNTSFAEDMKEMQFFVISHEDFQKLEVPQNVHFVSRFGYNPHEYIFAFYQSMDYIIVPSGAEGFGLPVLESMAVGTPVIHQLMPPFDEFTSWQWNYLVQPKNIEEYVDKDRMQKWKIYKFDPTEFASAIVIAKNAIDREERSENLKKLAKAYDVEKLYMRFIR
ncbi:putative glycosyltransferase [Sulfolobales Beppu rod-shaped virus 1]|uniref:Putative glycosyltransferase n=1 Tax=Sulfolobales Beppu rod-shaped virus 1 TaxID=2493121 RepID=A0A3Q8Q796_9VIRU|nr:putative glycosyltransferase [Sulfolobales Beppu rod-shaped virus 1]AZI75910.1 putative glycosyltransferase [Sulfolobales Beppu rod-shaped virus 1]